MKSVYLLIATFVILGLNSCKEKENQVSESNKNSKTEMALHSRTVAYKIHSKNYQSYIAYKGDSTVVKPVVLIIPEWWGVNDYAKIRADQLANLGYLAMAVDFYGEGKSTETPDEAEEWATPFYKDFSLAKTIFEGTLEEIKNFPNADNTQIAVIGYCFGGAQALNMARQFDNLKGAASFHGNLMTGVKPNNNKVKILVLNGEDDSFVSKEEITSFKSQMDSAKIDYKFINYPGAIHSFTNPASTEVGKKFGMKVAYNKEADEKSWEELKSFLNDIFKSN